MSTWMKAPLSKPSPVPAGQRGAVLVVSLLLLLILTLIGVASMETVVMQSQMSRNSQFSHEAFQIALSEIEGQLDSYQIDITPLISTVNSATDTTTLAAADFTMAGEIGNFAQSGQLTHVGEGVASGTSWGCCVAYKFELNSTANLAGTGSRSDQTQGFEYTAPGG